MFPQTHWLIGNVIGQAAVNEYPGCLNIKAFQTGCILPDFVSVKGIEKHIKRTSFEHVIDRMVKLQWEPNITALEVHKFSIELGIICHFISDYFCTPHNYEEKKPLFVKHAYYERILNHEFKKYDLEQICAAQLHNTILNPPFSIQSLVGYINHKHGLYLNDIPGMHNDLTYCMEASASVAMAIIKKCNQLEIKAA